MNKWSAATITRRCALALALGLFVIAQTFAATGLTHAADGDCPIMTAEQHSGHSVENSHDMAHAAHAMASDASITSDGAADIDADLCLGCDATGACGAAPALVAASSFAFHAVTDDPSASDDPSGTDHGVGSLRRPPRLI